MTDFMKPALILLESNDFLVTQDDDGNDTPMVFKDEAHLLETADRLVISLIYEPTLQVDDTCFDWLEGFTNRAGTLDAQIAWFVDGVTLEMLTQTSGDLFQYSELKIGTLDLTEGTFSVRLGADRDISGWLMDLRALTLRPTSPSSVSKNQ